MGLDNRLIAMGSEAPNYMNDFATSQAQGMKIGAARQEMAQKNKMAELMAAKPKGMPVSQYLDSQGMGSQALEFSKQEADISKTQADTSKAALEGHIKQLDIAARVAQGFLSQPKLSKQAILEGAQQYAQRGIIKLEDLQGMQQKISALPDDDQSLRSFLNQAVQSGMEAKDRLGLALQQSQQDITSQNNLVSQDLRAKEFGLNQQKFGLDQQQFGETKRNNTIEQKYKVAGLERDRANDEFNHGMETKKYELEQQNNNVGSKKSAGTQQLSGLLDESLSQIHELNKLGALSSPKKGVMQNLSSRIGNSYVGQAVGKAVGTKEQTVRDNIQNLKPRILSGIMAATGMSAKQMDSNVELQMAMNALGDPTQSVESQIKIIDNLKKIYVNPNATNNSGATEDYGIPANAPPEKAKAYQEYLKGFKR